MSEVLVYKAKWNYTAKQNELSFNYGQLMYLLEKTNEDWWKVKCNGKEGYALSSYLESAEDTTEFLLYKFLKSDHFDFNEDFHKEMGDKKRVGVAIIFADVSSTGPSGSDVDIETVRNTFKRLNYVTFTVPEPSSKAITHILEKMASEYPYPLNIGSIVIYFSCHGGCVDGKGYIMSVDNKKVFINDDITSWFTPKNTASIGDRKCLFFFDCCLTEENEEQQPAKLATKHLPVPAFLPPDGKRLIAYATSKRTQATSNAERGSIWTFTLFDHIVKYDLPITAILDKTCEEVAEKSMDVGPLVQSPYYASSLGTFFFRENTLEKAASYYEKNCLPIPDEEETPEDENQLQLVLTKEPEVIDVLKILAPYAYRWKDIGRSLNIMPGFLEELQERHGMSDIERLAKVLQYWIDTRCSEVSWNCIKKALENQLVGQAGIAKKLNIPGDGRSEPPMVELLEFLAPHANIWAELGTVLGVPKDMINGLQGTNSGIIKLSSVITKWKDTLSREPITWGTIIDMLNSKTVNLENAAVAVKEFLRGDGGKKYIKQ